MIIHPKYVASSLFAVCLCAFANHQAVAQSNVSASSPSQFKIGVVNLKVAFDAYDKQKNQYQDLEVQRDTKQKEIDKLSERITAARERYDAEKDTMSDSVRDALEESIEADFGLYKAEFKRLQEDIDRREKKLLEVIFEDIHQAIAEVGARGNYHLVFEGGESGRSGVLYFSTPLNMTQQVIDYLNEEYAKS